MPDREPTPRNEPQCWAGSSSEPGCAAPKFGVRVRQLESELEQAESRAAAAEVALKGIAEGKGEFSLDPLTHASNTIENMKAIANAFLASRDGKATERGEQK